MPLCPSAGDAAQMKIRQQHHDAIARALQTGFSMIHLIFLWPLIRY